MPKLQVPRVESWRDPFERALDEDPSDQRVRRDLADHLDEVCDPDGEALRWLADRGKWPVAPGPRGRDIESWDWYAEGYDTGAHSRYVGPEGHSVVPYGVYRELGQYKGAYKRRQGCRGAYDTRREAEADFCRAYHKAKAAGWNLNE